MVTTGDRDIGGSRGETLRRETSEQQNRHRDVKYSIGERVNNIVITIYREGGS